MELLLAFVFLLIGACVMYWVVRLGVRDGIADAREAEPADADEENEDDPDDD
ncbi:hypothetical protein [Glycomyces tritici]|uniref:Uncharacterized protein n=1 Tax=Glycomyces tritici TaxID=2665176 RepID=A0ABT7YUR4_9ACTN|nr:hypothetical protein [Glycomyces tritici]MDN3242378.1 hypothetical protein [Glycomyces tritici]